MKKTISFILSITILLALATFCFGAENISYKESNYTVIYDSNTAYTELQQQYIADMLIYGESDIVMVQPRAWCWLTGHDKTTEYVRIITHKVYEIAPRCVEELYEVTTCSKCDLYDMVLVSSVDISCCAEE